MLIRKKQDFKKLRSIWDSFLDSQTEELQKSLTDLEISALHTCIEDCYESFQEIYFKLIPALQRSLKQKNSDKIHSCVHDIYWDFEHIKNHTLDASKGLFELSNLLGKKAEIEEEKKKRKKKTE